MNTSSEKPGAVTGIETILIVDDCDDDRLLLRYYLESFHCRIIEASDGAEGLAAALRERPDLIISDANMPEMDGFQFLRAVRRSPEIRDVPFVFYSAVYTGDRDAELALSLGALAFIAKPKDPEEFHTELDQIVRKLEKEKGAPCPTLLENDEAYLRSYSRVVAAKLVDKVRKLRASESKFRKFFDTMRDVIIVVDGQRTIQDANEPALQHTFGYRLDEVIGKSARMLFPDEDTFRRLGEFYPPVPETRGTVLLETVYLRKNGERFHAEVSGNRLKDDTGTDIGYISVVRDITERKKLEEQLRHVQKMEALGTFAGGIAHDFNNIITAIIGFSSMIQSNLPPEDPSRENLREIMAAGERAASLTRSLLYYSKNDPICVEAVDVNEMIVQSSKLLQRLLGEDVLLEVKQAEGEFIVHGDRGQLEQVLMNLATNSRDAMPNGGKLLIETSRIEMNAEFLALHGYGKPGNYLLVTVTDTGSGMDETTRQRIFEPFFSTKASGEGTGLGLSIIYGIVKQHKGFVKVYSEPGKGASFRIYLPLVSEKGKKSGHPAMVSMRGGNEILLIVEDSNEIRALFAMILKEFGYRVHVAANGIEAVRILEEEQGHIDLALIDIILPGKNGRLVLDDLLAFSPHLKHIFMSGYPQDVISGKGLLETTEEYLQKPVVPNLLLGKVREILDRK
jgi:PAS domain S-box-containing protein